MNSFVTFIFVVMLLTKFNYSQEELLENTFSVCGNSGKKVAALYGELYSDPDRRHILLDIEWNDFPRRLKGLQSICSSGNRTRRQKAYELIERFAAEDAQYRIR